MPRIPQRDALDVLTRPRLLEIAAAVGLALPGRASRRELIDAIASSTRAPLRLILGQLKRDELKAICRATGLDDSGREKASIADRILGLDPEGGRHTLTKADLVDDVTVAAGVLRRDAEVIVNAMIEAMTDSLRSGVAIEIRNFGSFRFRRRGPRIGRNPKTGVEIEIPAKRVCFFKPGSTLLEIVNP